MKTLEVNIACIHHWIIEAADGVNSPGVCKYCGAKREFRNALDYLAAIKQEAAQRRKHIKEVYENAPQT